MTQFIQLDKFTTRTVSEVAPFIFNKDSFLISEKETIRDASDGHQFVATRVTLLGTPEYTFYTLVDQDVLATALGTVDVTQGLTPGGSSCAGDPGVMDTITYDAEYPMLKLLKILNKVTTNTLEYVCNTNEILYIEEIVYQDKATQMPATALVITFTSTTPRRVMTKLSFADISALLDPDIVV